MLAYKAFAPGLKCRDYQFSRGKNVTDQAFCVRKGFHAAENPLDCLSYYRWDGKNEFWIVEVAGDIDEDGRDSKVSCTELTPLVRLDEESYLLAAVAYMMQHPGRKCSAPTEPFHICRGEAPVIRAKKGDWLLLAREQDGQIVDYAVGRAREKKEYTISELKKEAGHEEG